MRTIFEAYYKNSDVVAYRKYESNDILCEYTYDTYGNKITYKGSDGFSYKCTYDKNGNQTSYEDSTGFSYKYTLDENGNQIAYKSSYGCWRVKGKIVSEKEYETFIAQLNSKNLDGIEAEIEGRKYKLKLIK